MANETPKPTLDGIRPTRSVDGMAGGPAQPVKPSAQPQSAPVRMERRQAVATPAPVEPAPAPVAPEPAPVAPAQTLPAKPRRGRRILAFIIGLVLVVAALGGIYYIYLNFYA